MKTEPALPHFCLWLGLLPFMLFSLLLSVPLASAQAGETMIITVYSDGKACPNHCDAHVVFNNKHNGTLNAFLPGQKPGVIKDCIDGQRCRICFDAQGDHCMNVMYRKGGPAINRFDFTPAFINEYCDGREVPPELGHFCKNLKPNSRTFRSSINCIKQPQHERCREIMAQAEQRQQADTVIYDRCIKLTEEEFNKHVGPAEQRKLNCAYAENKVNKKWDTLLPGACYKGTYVGKDGMDCCTGQPEIDQPFGNECKPFYLTP